MRSSRRLEACKEVAEDDAADEEDEDDAENAEVEEDPDAEAELEASV